ncbi:MAG: polymer-forming cytoskeletal protein [Gammaproteobacteria bacterium]|nr:polymer-forming cytoskeletal protein [Gammaproteobacteria bacterium]MYA66997.1 polymer-forming cytoskeletal protein [Gammaproteobacteria bacterium]MYG95788.1 polymer-forming cytoskeletal protein [Gammaproteobacteria bacterium]MYH47106.1 polymer-forming cytoskeletal protein [Gammaproteobacteria bacterium]MYL14464.1 polymer-forming cytoskeletal protein [Gammaproteobacteria bacterium]
MTTDSTKNHTLISGATTVNGDIHFEGELIIEGRVVGKVLAEEGSEAQLRVAESGSIEGDVEVPLVVINGNVNGNVRASKHIELAAQGLVNGNVVYNLIEMVMGSAVNGSLTRMDREEPEIALLELDKEEGVEG